MATTPSALIGGLQRLADLNFARAGGPTELIDAVLALLGESLEVGLTHVSRFEGSRQRILAVHNRAGMALGAGDTVALSDSYCRRLAESQALVVEDSRADPEFAALPATAEIGIGSYCGVPVYRADGSLFGSLCALDPAPRAVHPSEVTLLALAGRVLGGVLEQQEEHDQEQTRARQQVEEALQREQEARARAEAALQARNDFLTRASHELRTPLTVLQLHLQTWTARMRGGVVGIDDQRLPAALDNMADQVRRLTRLSADMVVAAGGPTERAAGVSESDLRLPVQAAIGEFRTAFERRGHGPRVHAPEPLLGWWDTAAVRHIVANLLSNALRFAPEGEIEVRVEEHGDRARITVRDGGIGVAPADQQRIFAALERIDSPDNVGGLGLGLTVARRLAAACDGAITLESVPGGGAAFHVDLPRTGTSPAAET